MPPLAPGEAPQGPWQSRHCRFVPTAGQTHTPCRGGDSRARRCTCARNRLSIKWQTPKACHCEGALHPWQSRGGTSRSYRVTIKRTDQLRLQRRSLCIRWRLCRLTDAACPLRVVSALYRAIQPRKGAGAPRHCLMCHCEERSDVGISQYPFGSQGNLRRKRNCLHEIATAPLGPRNDKPLAFTVLSAACTGRQYRAGSGMPLPYNGRCMHRERPQICGLYTVRRGRRTLQHTIDTSTIPPKNAVSFSGDCIFLSAESEKMRASGALFLLRRRGRRGQESADASERSWHDVVLSDNIWAKCTKSGEIS